MICFQSLTPLQANAVICIAGCFNALQCIMFMQGFPHWAHYIRGVLSLFPQPFGTLDAVIVSDVPIGAGLSSSAALEVSPCF